MAHGWRRLLPAIALLGLASCSDRMPTQPRVANLVETPNGASLDSTLEANRARWSASRISSYRYRFRWECFCVQDRIRVVDITVVRGTIVSVVDAQTRQPLDAQAVAKYRTIDGLFDFVREAIDYPASSIRTVFEQDLGYPAEVGVDYVANIADEEMAFRVYWLRPHLQP